MEPVRIPDLSSVAECAQLLGVSEQHVRRLLAQGELQGTRVGGSWVVSRADLEAALPTLSHTTIAPRRDFQAAAGTLRALSFFSGAMGLDQGMELSGVATILACENDKSSRATIATNRPDIPVLEDINAYDAAQVRDLAGLQATEAIDVVAGGPPCQAFSTAGARRGFNDARGNVFLKFLGLATELNPRFIVIENVRGLLSMPAPNAGDAGSAYDHRHGAVELVRDRLERAGYRTTFNLYSAANFGVPQSRERVVVVASRDEKLPYLSPTHSFDGSAGLPRWRTLRDAIGDMRDVDHHFDEFPAKRLRYFEMLTEGQYWKHLPLEEQPAAMGKSLHLSGGRTGFYRRLAWDKPAPTLVTHPAMPATDLCHPELNRPLSVEEYAAIQQFRPEWILRGNLRDRYRQLGNAVPVGLGAAIGRQLVEAVSGRVTEPPAGFKFSRYRDTSDAVLFGDR